MAAFAVISTGPAGALEAAVKAIYTGSYQSVSPTVWLVADKGITTQGVSEKLGIGAGKIENAVIIKVDSYWGRAAKTLWEWLAVNGSTD